MDIGDALTHQTPLTWALLVYSSLGCGALATYLQTLGQATVPPTLAQVCGCLAVGWGLGSVVAFFKPSGMCCITFGHTPKAPGLAHAKAAH